MLLILGTCAHACVWVCTDTFLSLLKQLVSVLNKVEVKGLTQAGGKAQDVALNPSLLTANLPPGARLGHSKDSQWKFNLILKNQRLHGKDDT